VYGHSGGGTVGGVHIAEILLENDEYTQDFGDDWALLVSFLPQVRLCALFILLLFYNYVLLLWK
jgi:hypothetical protein